MTVSDANALIDYHAGRRRLMEDPTLNDWAKARALVAVDKALNLAPPQTGMKLQITPGGIVRGAIGAGLGSWAGKLIGGFLSSDPHTQTRFQDMGMGIGTMALTGHAEFGMGKQGAANMLKHARAAAKIGFLQALVERDALVGERAKKVAAVIIDPEAVTAPFAAAKGLAATVTGGTGAGLASMVNPDETDEDILKMNAEREALKQQIRQLSVQDHNALIGKLLRARRDKKAEGAYNSYL